MGSPETVIAEVIVSPHSLVGCASTVELDGVQSPSDTDFTHLATSPNASHHEVVGVCPQAKSQTSSLSTIIDSRSHHEKFSPLRLPRLEDDHDDARVSADLVDRSLVDVAVKDAQAHDMRRGILGPHGQPREDQPNGQSDSRNASKEKQDQVGPSAAAVVSEDSKTEKSVEACDYHFAVAEKLVAHVVANVLGTHQLPMDYYSWIKAALDRETKYLLGRSQCGNAEFFASASTFDALNGVLNLSFASDCAAVAEPNRAENITSPSSVVCGSDPLAPDHFIDLPPATANQIQHTEGVSSTAPQDYAAAERSAKAAVSLITQKLSLQASSAPRQDGELEAEKSPLGSKKAPADEGAVGVAEKVGVAASTSGPSDLRGRDELGLADLGLGESAPGEEMGDAPRLVSDPAPMIATFNLDSTDTETGSDQHGSCPTTAGRPCLAAGVPTNQPSDSLLQGGQQTLETPGEVIKAQMENPQVQTTGGLEITVREDHASADACVRGVETGSVTSTPVEPGRDCNDNVNDNVCSSSGGEVVSDVGMEGANGHDASNKAEGPSSVSIIMQALLGTEPSKGGLSSDEHPDKHNTDKHMHGDSNVVVSSSAEGATQSGQSLLKGDPKKVSSRQEQQSKKIKQNVFPEVTKYMRRAGELTVQKSLGHQMAGRHHKVVQPNAGHRDPELDAVQETAGRLAMVRDVGASVAAAQMDSAEFYSRGGTTNNYTDGRQGTTKAKVVGVEAATSIYGVQNTRTKRNGASPKKVRNHSMQRRPEPSSQSTRIQAKERAVSSNVAATPNKVVPGGVGCSPAVLGTQSLRHTGPIPPKNATRNAQSPRKEHLKMRQAPARDPTSSAKKHATPSGDPARNNKPISNAAANNASPRKAYGLSRNAKAESKSGRTQSSHQGESRISSESDVAAAMPPTLLSGGLPNGNGNFKSEAENAKHAPRFQDHDAVDGMRQAPEDILSREKLLSPNARRRKLEVLARAMLKAARAPPPGDCGDNPKTRRILEGDHPGASNWRAIMGASESPRGFMGHKECSPASPQGRERAARPLSSGGKANETLVSIVTRTSLLSLLYYRWQAFLV